MSKTFTPLSAETKDQILNAVLDWELDTPYAERTVGARKASSRQIAEAFDVDVLQVGGVRSNLAAGRYGSMKHLRSKRRRVRNAATA